MVNIKFSTWHHESQQKNNFSKVSLLPLDKFRFYVFFQSVISPASKMQSTFNQLVAYIFPTSPRTIPSIFVNQLSNVELWCLLWTEEYCLGTYHLIRSRDIQS